MKRRNIRILGWLLALVFAMGAIGASAEAAPVFQAGIYQAEARGHNGMVTIEAEFSDSRIEAIRVAGGNETPVISDAAYDKLIPQILENQSVNVDTVAGATMSTNVLKTAVTDCIRQAGANPDDFMAEMPKAPVSETPVALNTPVLVVGAGLSGLSAAVSAAQSGTEVLVIERLAYVGGNSRLSTGVFAFGGTDLQAANGIEETPEQFSEFLFEAARKQGGERDATQVMMVANNSNATWHWLTDCGVTFDDTVTQAMGSAVPHNHQATPDAPAVCGAMYQRAQELGVTFMLETMATALATDGNGRVTGVKATSAQGQAYDINASETILATGGFLANTELSEKYYGFENLNYIGCPGSRGEMMLAAMELGASTTQLDVPFLSPTYSRAYDVVITSLVLSKGAILVDHNAQRYSDECSSYVEVAKKTFALKEPNDIVYEIFDEHVNETCYKVKDYIALGCVIQKDTIEELAAELTLDADALKATIDDYNKACAGEKEDTFGREILGSGILQAPFYAIRVNPGSNIAGGGLTTDGDCHVLNADGQIMNGLFAVGELVGGYRGYGYAGGDALAHCSVTGKIAGEQAAQSVR